MTAITAFYPGTFDPITHGHRDIVTRAARLFDRVIVGVALTNRKQFLLPHKQRIELAQAVLADLPNVEVMGFSGLTVEFAKKQAAQIVLRGLRGASDVEYELEMSTMNRQMAPNIETLFLTPDEQYARISSTMVREIAKLGGDVSMFVDKVVVEALNFRAA